VVVGAGTVSDTNVAFCAPAAAAWLAAALAPDGSDGPKTTVPDGELAPPVAPAASTLPAAPFGEDGADPLEEPAGD
jgi:hypothetical protein